MAGELTRGFLTGALQKFVALGDEKRKIARENELLGIQREEAAAGRAAEQSRWEREQKFGREKFEHKKRIDELSLLIRQMEAQARAEKGKQETPFNEGKFIDQIKKKLSLLGMGLDDTTKAAMGEWMLRNRDTDFRRALKNVRGNQYHNILIQNRKYGKILDASGYDALAVDGPAATAVLAEYGVQLAYGPDDKPSGMQIIQDFAEATGGQATPDQLNQLGMALVALFASDAVEPKPAAGAGTGVLSRLGAQLGPTLPGEQRPPAPTGKELLEALGIKTYEITPEAKERAKKILPRMRPAGLK